MKTSGAVYFLILQICGYDPAADRYTRDCRPFVSDEPTTWDDCNATARWWRATSPAGVRVIAHGCVKTRPEQAPEVARR